MQRTHDEIHAPAQPNDGEFSDGPPLAPRPRSATVGLTFTQQWIWHGLELSHSASMRIVAAAVRLSGRLNVECLRLTILEVTRRHEALRTRIAVVDGLPTQQVEETGHLELETVDLSGLPKDERDTAARRVAEQFLYKPTIVAAEPLFATMLVKLDERAHVLVLAMDHLISDGASKGILLRETLAIYAAFAQGISHALPAIPVQFPDFAVWQQNTRRRWNEKHGGYWNERLAGAQRLRLLAADPHAEGGGAKWRVLRIQFDANLSGGLRELSGGEEANLAMTALTAYIALILRWSDQTDCVVQFMTAGRLHPEVKNTIGFFAAPLFLRVGLQQDDTLLDLLRRIAREYRAAREHNDCGAIAARRPAPSFGCNPQFNWHRPDFDLRAEPREQDREDDGLLRTTQYDLPVTMRDGMELNQDFGLRLRDTPDGIVGAIVYRADRVAVSTVERFSRNLCLFAQALAKTPDARVTSLSCAPETPAAAATEKGAARAPCAGGHPSSCL
jgi:Condensation domain